MQTDIVLESLRRLCALRTRAGTVDARRKLVAKAEERMASASEAEQRRARILRVTFEDKHVSAVDAKLRDTQGRLGTARNHLSRFTDALTQHHQNFTDEKIEALSSARGHMAMARIIADQAKTLEENIEIFRRVIQGAVAEPLSGHVGATDGKAWHHLRAETLLTLKQAGAHYSLGQMLFPDLAPRRAEDVDAKERSRKKMNKAIERAKKRSSPKT